MKEPTEGRAAPLGSSGLDRAVLLISIDVEMAWGVTHRPEDVYDFPDERDQMKRLLDLFDEYDVPATWAFVGHLFLDGCDAAPKPHPELVRPDYAWFSGDWLAQDPCTSLAADPKWYAPDLLADVRSRAVGHEIGSHSFSHLIVDDPGCTEHAFRSDLRHCCAAAAERNVDLRSFIFPRNAYGQQHVLAQEGYTSYRGAGPDPYLSRWPGGRYVRRAMSTITARGSRSAVYPIREDGIWNFPATYLHVVGPVRRYPIRMLQARRRLDQAVRERGLFHVWFHPHNLRQNPDLWFSGLEGLLSRAASLRAAHRLEARTMGQLADTLDGVTTS